MPKAKPCIECRARPKIQGRARCVVCYWRREPIDDRVAEAMRRLSLIPDELRIARVPAKDWPEGERWCASCQSFVPLEDCRGSRCIPCASMASHAAMVLKTYGVTPARYRELLELQGNRCAICRQRPRSKRLAVDHDHKSGEVRGLLCGRCNHELLGAGFDSAAVLLAAYHYLSTPPALGGWSRPEDGLSAAISRPGVLADPDELVDPGGGDAAPVAATSVPVALRSASPEERLKAAGLSMLELMALIASAKDEAPF